MRARLSLTARTALEALAEGPMYLLSRRFFGRRGALSPGPRNWRRRREPLPLVTARTAQWLTDRGLTRISRSGNPDRNPAFMLSLTHAGRACATRP